MTNRKIIVVDDNMQNGQLLHKACRLEAPEWDFLFLQVTSLEPPDYLPDDFTDDNYKFISNLKEAADSISEVAKADDCELIVFYDCQLLDLQTKTSAAASNSPITSILRNLMSGTVRKVVVNVHSADLAAHEIGGAIEKDSPRVIIKAITDKTFPEIIAVVRETKQLWESLYAEKSVSLREFIDAMQEMYHLQIQNFDGFIKKVEEKKRDEFQDPKQLLMQFLGMGKIEFENNFCESSRNLKPAVIEAMKSISGVVDQETERYESRPLTWTGGWILALGQFRSFPFRDLWKNVFKPEDLEKGDHSPIVHAYQTKGKRTATLELFGEMCSVLFLKKGTLDQSVLDKVTLNDERFSFLLNFPCVSPGEDRENSLLDRILSEADHAVNMTYKTERQLSVKEGHDTSRAIWRVFLSSHISDLSELIGKVDYGLFGRFTRMNIISVEGVKTEVIWRKR
jgi:hypothetical protein